MNDYNKIKKLIDVDPVCGWYGEDTTWEDIKKYIPKTANVLKAKNRDDFLKIVSSFHYIATDVNDIDDGDLIFKTAIASICRYKDENRNLNFVTNEKYGFDEEYEERDIAVKGSYYEEDDINSYGSIGNCLGVYICGCEDDFYYLVVFFYIFTSVSTDARGKFHNEEEEYWIACSRFGNE